MRQNHHSAFSIIKIVYKGRTYEFDLINMFEKLRLKGNIIEAKLKNSSGPIWNTEFFNLKQSIEGLFPIALELANKEMLENDERNVIYDIEKHYFAIDYIQLQKHKDSILKIEFQLDCLMEDGEPLY